MLGSEPSGASIDTAAYEVPLQGARRGGTLHCFLRSPNAAVLVFSVIYKIKYQKRQELKMDGIIRE